MQSWQPSHALIADVLLPWCYPLPDRGLRVAAERHCQGHACSHATASSTPTASSRVVVVGIKTNKDLEPQHREHAWNLCTHLRSKQQRLHQVTLRTPPHERGSSSALLHHHPSVTCAR